MPQNRHKPCPSSPWSLETLSPEQAGMSLIRAVWCILRLFRLPPSQLVLENLALRQQLAVLSRQRPRPTLRRRDRFFWLCLSKWWPDWRLALVLVQPDTVVGWHRQVFRVWWGWKCRTKRAGRPSLAKEIRALIRRMARENPTWGSPRIQAELRLLGHEVAEATVAKYRARHRKPSSPTWKSFLRNHVGMLASMDFFVVPTATFRLLYVFVILSHPRRHILHFNVTIQPTAAWVGANCGKRSPLRPRRVTSSATAMASTGSRCVDVYSVWASRKSSQLRDPPGRILTAKG